MTTMFAGPFVPPGYDLGFPFDSLLDEDTPSLPYDFGQGMTQTYPVLEDQVSFWSLQPPASSQNDVPNPSPGGDPLQAPAASQCSASLSPAGTIFTPTSTLLEYDEGNTPDDAAFQNVSASPRSNTFSADDFVHVNTLDDDTSSASGSVISHPPRSSGVPPSSRAALASTQQSVPTADRTLQHPQCHRMSSSPMDTTMEDGFVPYTSSADLALPVASWADDDLLSQTSAFNTFFARQTYPRPFRTLDHGSSQQTPTTASGLSIYPQQTVVIHGQTNTSHPTIDTGPGLTQNRTDVRSPQQQELGNFHQCHFAHRNILPAHVPSNPSSQQYIQQHVLLSQAPRDSQSQQVHVAVPIAKRPVAPAPADHLMPNQQQHVLLDYSSSTELSNLGSRRGRQADPLPYASSTTATQTSRRLARRDLAQASYGPVRPPQTDRTKRGGRQKNMHLSTETRQQSHEMRKKGACWRCAMQRDPCDHGDLDARRSRRAP